MTFYLFILVLSSGSAFCASFAKDTYAGNLLKLATFLILFIPAALRYEIGEDYNDYRVMYNDISNGKFSNKEIGYVYLNFIISRMGGNFQTVMAAMAFLTYGLFCLAFPKKYFYLFIPILVMNIYMWSYQSVRQIFTVAVGYYAYKKYYLQEKYIKFLLAIAIACLFHSSAIIYLVIILFFKTMKINAYSAFFLFAAISLIYFRYTNQIINIVINLIISKTHYSYYLGSSWWDPVSIGGGLGVLFRSVLLGIIILFSKKTNLTKQDNEALIVFLIFALFNMFFLKIHILGRISRSLLFSHFLMAESIFTSKLKYRKILLLFIYFAFFVMFFLSIAVDGGYGSVPYRTRYFTYSIYQR